LTNYVFRAVRGHEVALAAEQFIAAFGSIPTDQAAIERRFRDHLAAGELWGVDAGGALVGHCRLLATDRFFGGRPVRCMDVSGVSVPEQHRRKGVATALLEGAVAWGAHERLGLGMLFPAVVPLYRRLGWEPAGTFPRYRLDTPLLTPSSEAMRTATAADWPAIERCADAYAATLNGPGRRRPRRWEGLRAAERRYVLDGGSGVDAYVLVYRGADPTESLRASPSVDWAATTPRGVRAVVSLLASGALGPTAMLHAPTNDFWTPWLDSWIVPESSGLFWMARGLKLPEAIAARGFPTGLEAAVTLAVDDPIVLEAQGPWRLEVSGGRGVLEPAGSADIVMDVRAFGPLFTGFRSPQQLALAGLLDGPEAALDALAAMFSGPPPVVLDFF
jgi:GNAT superfamily N-acetyltransferase